MINRIAAVAIAIAGSMVLSPEVHAEDAGVPGAAAEPAVLEEVLVTARRREESSQDVPIALSVLDAKTLEATGSFNVAKLTQLQPSLQFYSTNPRNSAANVRGLGAPFGLTNDGIEQGVGIYVDEVYYSRIAAATFDFLDIEQLEVLRGPQGTLYGKNTTAGAINITTRKPTFEREGRAEVTVGSIGQLQAKAALSGPIVDDKLAGRLAVSSTTRRGTIYDTASQKWVNSLDNLGIRGQLLWKAADRLNVTFAGDYNHQDPECCAQIYVRAGSTQRALNRQYAALATAFNYAPPSTNPFDRVTDLDVNLAARQTLGGASVRADWQVGPGTFTSVTAWRYWDWSPSNDRDFTGLPITTVSANPSQQRQTTQEFRYSVTGQKVDYVLGLFGFDQKLDTQGQQQQGSAASRWLLNPTCAAANNPATLGGLTSNNDIHFKNTSLAAFGQASWHITDRFGFEPGVRVNYDDKDGTYVATVRNATNTALTSDQLGVLAPQSYAAQFRKWNVSGDVKLTYKLAEDALVYGSYARGFKSGGINLSGLPLDAANNPILSAASVRPEKVNSFEAGVKSQFLNRRLTFNVAAFSTDIGDYQATVTNGQLGVIRGYLANAEKVRVRGVETDIAIQPTAHFSAYVNTAYTDGRYVTFKDAPCPPELAGGTTVTGTQVAGPAGVPGSLSPANCDISGQWLPGISKWAFSYGAEQQLPVHALGLDGNAYIALEGNYRSTFSSNPSRSIYTDIPSYAVNNVRVGFRATRTWEVFGWVRNVFNRQYFDVLATTPGNTGLIVGQPADARTAGVTFKAQF